MNNTIPVGRADAFRATPGSFTKMGDRLESTQILGGTSNLGASTPSTWNRLMRFTGDRIDEMKLSKWDDGLDVAFARHWAGPAKMYSPVDGYHQAKAGFAEGWKAGRAALEAEVERLRKWADWASDTLVYASTILGPHATPDTSEEIAMNECDKCFTMGAEIGIMGRPHEE